ncbi:MAG: hypothetical protein JWQ01_4911 [Massilia sp.]|nr:hypothetical protein [Massilia sp.]
MRKPDPLSAVQRQCLIAATIEPLAPFPRGFAHTKNGPFFDVRTIHSLVQRGELRMIKNRAGRQYGSVTARAA